MLEDEEKAAPSIVPCASRPAELADGVPRPVTTAWLAEPVVRAEIASLPLTLTANTPPPSG